MKLKRTRVILGANCYCDAESTLELASVLAQQVGAELRGLLVHETSVLYSVNQLQARTVSYSGLRSATVTADTLLKAYQSDARHFKRHLSNAAKASALESSFEEIEGSLTDVLRTQAGNGDIIVLGYKTMFDQDGPVVLIMGDQSDLPEFAINLTRKLRKQLHILLSDPRNKDIVATEAAKLGTTAIVRAYDTSNALIASLERTAATAVVLADYSPGSPMIARLLEAARCPLIVQTDTGVSDAQLRAGSPRRGT